MRVVFLGAPGVGKGTQGERLSAQFGWPKISTGDLLREAVKRQTPLGKDAKHYMDQGQLVPDSVVVGLVREKLAESGCAKGFILDGFPRTVPQAEELDQLLSTQQVGLSRVVNFRVPREAIVQRLSGRRSCPKCQAVFHVDFAPSKRGSLCDRCGAALVQRSDDRRDTIEARLQVYDEQTAPLIDYYQRQGLLVNLEAEGPVDAVYGKLVALLPSQGGT